jgi:putative SOS response-associated peptidase YedK
MCTNYVPSTRHEIAASRLGVLQLPPEQWPDEVYPGFAAPVVVRGSGGAPECRVARFGLVPHWSRDAAQAKDISRMTYNARSETVAQKPSYRTPWQQRQWILAPMRSFFEPSWAEAAHNGGRSVRWQVERADGDMFCVAGLWDRWLDRATGEVQETFTLLTVNADGHAVMGQLHKPDEEKRMPAIIAADRYADWLNATPANAMQFLQPLDAALLTSHASPRPERQLTPSRRKPASPKAKTPDGSADSGENLSLF